MVAPDNQRLDELVESARKRPTSERAAFLVDACGGDQAVIGKVEARLREDTLALSALPEPSDTSPYRIVGLKIGHYSVKRVIASGGMGTVYEALQEHPRRVVALKVMKAGISSRSALRRFEYEAQILARLHHPGIAQIYEAGVHEQGPESVPYFAMEYIAGSRPITSYAREHKLGTRARLELFAKVCDAVHHGHQRGIIHRDLKPSNILVESEGEPKIIDFGVARATDSDLAITTLQTDVGQLIGTLQYMSPEQCDADPHDIDVRSDIYALGVLLYELLAERLPYDVSRAALGEAMRVIKEEPPSRLSTIHRSLRGDIETIALKALEKDRKRRYQSAAALAQDLQHYLRSEPISARPPSVVYQIRMLARKSRVALLTVAGFLLGLGIAAGLLSWAATSAEGRRATAAAAAADAVAERDAAIRVRDEAYDLAYASALEATEAFLSSGRLNAAERSLRAAPESRRGWEWQFLHGLVQPDKDSIDIFAHNGAVSTVCFLPGGQEVVSGGAEYVRVWDLRKRQVSMPPVEHHSYVRCLAPDESGDRIATACLDWRARIIDRSSGAVQILQHEGAVNIALWSPDEQSVLTASDDGTARLWDVATGRELRRLSEHGAKVLYAAFSRDGSRIVTASDDHIIRVCASATGDLLQKLEGHAALINWVCFDGTGERVLSASDDNTARLWDLRGGPPRTLAHKRNVIRAVFTGDGRRVVTTSLDGRARIFDAETGASATPTLFHGGELTEAAERSADEADAGVLVPALSPDGGLLATCSRDGTTRIWDTGSGAELSTFPHPKPVRNVGFDQNGDRIITACDDGHIRVWNLVPARSRKLVDGDGRVNSVSIDKAGNFVVAACEDGRARVCRINSGECLSSFPDTPGPMLLAASFDDAGGRVVTGDSRGGVAIWNAFTAQRFLRLGGHTAAVQAATFDRTGARVLTGSDDGKARVWDSQTGAQLAEFTHPGGVKAALFSPHGDVIATGCDDGAVRIWPATAADQPRQVLPHTGQIMSVAFDKRAERLLVATHDRNLHLWNLKTGIRERTYTAGASTNPFTSAAFSPDESRIVAGSMDETVSIWDTGSDRLMLTLRGHTAEVLGVSFDPRGDSVISCSADGSVRVWGRQAPGNPAVP